MPIKKDKRQMVYFGPCLREHVSGLRGGSVSGRLEKTAERYDSIKDDCSLENSLTDDEIRHIDDVLGDKKVEMVDIHYLYESVEDSFSDEDASDYVDTDELARKLKKSTLAERIMLIEHLGR